VMQVVKYLLLGRLPGVRRTWPLRYIIDKAPEILIDTPEVNKNKILSESKAALMSEMRLSTSMS
jgi:hypothetical protein